MTVRLSSDTGEQQPRQLIVVVTHPRITRPNQAFSTQDSFPTPVLRDLAYAGWTFDHPWEQQPGERRVTFMNEGEVVASKTFTITVPPPEFEVLTKPGVLKASGYPRHTGFVSGPAVALPARASAGWGGLQTLCQPRT